MNTEPKYILHNDRIYQPAATAFFEGYEPVESIPKKTPTLMWRQAKIPLSVWHPLVAFMRKFYAHECQAGLYYHLDTQQWKAWVWPQTYGTGMTTKELPDHAQREVQWAAQFGFGWDKAGTVHHHCNSGAFQSGTDREDEIHTPGIHITLGKMTDTKMDSDVRLSFRETFYEARLHDFIERPEEVTKLPVCVWDTCMEVLALEYLPPGQTWPKEWEENLIEPPKSAGFPSGAGNWIKMADGAWKQLNTPALPYHSNWKPQPKEERKPVQQGRPYGGDEYDYEGAWEEYRKSVTESESQGHTANEQAADPETIDEIKEEEFLCHCDHLGYWPVEQKFMGGDPLKGLDPRYAADVAAIAEEYGLSILEAVDLAKGAALEEFEQVLGGMQS